MRATTKRTVRLPARWAFLAAGLAAFGAAQAADTRTPKGPIELTVGSGAGSVPDTFMRRAAKILNEEKIVENPIGVVNRAGGSWMTAANHVLNRPKDENLVITVSTGALFATPIVQGIPTVHDRLTPLGMFVFNDLVLIANPSVPVSNLKELAAHGKKSETRLRFGGAQAASVDRIIAGLVDRATGLKLNYIPFDGGGAVTAAFLGGNVELTATAADEAVELVKSGKAKALAILTEQRRAEPELKDIATAKEQGFDGLPVREDLRRQDVELVLDCSGGGDVLVEPSRPGGGVRLKVVHQCVGEPGVACVEEIPSCSPVLDPRPEQHLLSGPEVILDCR